MYDPIERKAAIEAVIDADYKDCGVLVERRCRKFEEALRSLPAVQPITENDLIELQDRFGDEVRFVVEDMLSGEEKRWTT